LKLTHFFVLLFILSISLFVFLEPQAHTELVKTNVAQLELEDFTLYQINKDGVQSVISGTKAEQFASYYLVDNAHYIENKNNLGEHLYADKGRFEKEVAYLDDNVRYFREDGLSFESDSAVYHTKDEYLYVPGAFVLTQNEHIIYGNDLHYHSKSGDIKAKQIQANYYTQDVK